MNKNQLENFLSEFSGSESSYPFGPDAQVYKVFGKMYALVTQNIKPDRVTFKCTPEDNLFLVGKYDSIIPGYHMNKKHWITITLTNEIADEMLMKLARNSFELVVSKLTKEKQRKIEIMELS